MTADELEKDESKKTAFAIAWLQQPKEPFKAALSIEGNTGNALYMAHHWVNDSFVLAEKERLLDEHGSKAFLPSKEDLARKVFETADGAGDPDDKYKGFRLYAEIMGYIEKPGVTVNNNTVTQNRVMVVNSLGSNDEWEVKALQQQQALAHASSNC